MCGIFAYIGNNRNATEAVFEGLKRLDYRGYDSWGISILNKSRIQTQKNVGVVNKKLLILPKSEIAIGHTRWATTGGVTIENAHPHMASDKSFALAQNGIVENYTKIKKWLLNKKYRFASETDTEVIVHLIEEHFKNEDNFLSAVLKAFKKCEGRNTIIILTRGGDVIGVRNGSPLVVGVSNKKGDVYFSSDTLSFAPYVDKTITLDNGQVAIYSKNKLVIRNIKNGKIVRLNMDKNTIKEDVISKDGYKHFMIKEISEQPEVIRKVIMQNEKSMNKLTDKIRNSENVYIIGSGTAGTAAFQTAYYLRTLGNINAIGLIGAEAKDYFHLFKKNDLLIALSQSGETADVLDVIEHAKEKRVTIASYVNMQGSLITKLSDFKFLANAGPEICVMSTKVLVSQLSWGYLLAKTLQGRYKEAVSNLQKLSINAEKLIKDRNSNSNINKIAKELFGSRDIFLLAKGQNLQIIREGMIKIVEAGYIHAHAIPAGDLKHYAITLMEKGVKVISVISDDENRTDTLNAINEIKARGATIIGVSPFKDNVFDKLIKVPDMGEVSAILNIMPIQILAYKIAILKGNNIDKPRNIAKSVTVK